MHFLMLAAYSDDNDNTHLMLQSLIVSAGSSRVNTEACSIFTRNCLCTGKMILGAMKRYGHGEKIPSLRNVQLAQRPALAQRLGTRS